MTDKQINTAIASILGITRKTGIPDFCGDLNEMHEAEKMHRMGTDWDEYALLLGALCGNPIYATARQRAEAFLRTLGKWDGLE